MMIYFLAQMSIIKVGILNLKVNRTDERTSYFELLYILDD